MSRYDFPCIAPDCHRRDEHAETCEDDDCKGCVPWRAADGVMLCRVHVERLRRLIAELPSLHDELTLALTRQGATGDAKRVSRGLSLEPAVVAARDHVVMWLWSWTRIVMEERGLRGPRRDDVNTVAAWLLQHADWLSAQPYADEVSSELAETSAEALRVRQAANVKRFEVKLPNGEPVGCTTEAEGPLMPGRTTRPTCNGTLTAIVHDLSSMLPGALVCSGDGGHKVPADQWHGLGRRLNRPFDEKAVRELAAVIRRPA